jgi:bifunctional DNA primase/polymerase-like protein/AAA domain-containing protein
VSTVKVGPYAQAAGAYWQAGWRGVVPIPANSKRIQIVGYTGREGTDPTRADVQAWADGREGSGNIALRMPPTVIGVDVDVDPYGAKAGGNTLRQAEEKFGPLPPTSTSTSRDDGISGIQLFRVPEGLAWPGEVGPGVEIVQHNHRYAVVWPSVHPEGRVYRWIGPDGAVADTVPSPDELPELPAAWVAGLTGGTLDRDVPKADLDADEALGWLAKFGAGEPCTTMSAETDRIVTSLANGSRHDAAMTGSARLTHLAADGHRGAAYGLSVLQVAFKTATAADPARPTDPGEFKRLLHGAIAIAAAQTGEDVPADPCRVTVLEDDDQQGAAGPFAKSISFAELDQMTFREPSYLVPHVVVLGGVVLLAGAPKIGKSHLALGIGLAVAQGGKALGAAPVTHAGPVLFISLDDTSAGRAQERARTINLGQPLPANMRLHTEHNLGRGEQARDNLHRYLRGPGKGTVLVVIDTLSHLRGERGRTEGVYDADVRFMAILRTLVPDNPDTTFLGLAHIRKQAADDGVMAISGTYGITGGADSLITMTGNRHAPGRALEVINRDDPGGEYALKFTNDGLILTDDDPHDPTLFMSEDDGRVYQALVGCNGPATAGDIGQMLPLVNKIGDRLARLVRHGAARRVRRGTFEAL